MSPDPAMSGRVPRVRTRTTSAWPTGTMPPGSSSCCSCRPIPACRPDVAKAMLPPQPRALPVASRWQEHPDGSTTAPWPVVPGPSGIVPMANGQTQPPRPKGAVGCSAELCPAILRRCGASEYLCLKLNRNPTLDIFATRLSCLDSFPKFRTPSPRPQKVCAHRNNDSQQ